MSASAAIKYLDRLEEIGARFLPVIHRAAERVPYSKRKRFWNESVKAMTVGFNSIRVPKIVHDMGQEDE